MNFRITPNSLTAMNTISHRLVIYAKDVERITGRRPRAAQKILQRIRRRYNKQFNDFVTVEEFCEFLKLKESSVRACLL